MTLQELAHNLPAIRDEAKALWGDSIWTADDIVAKLNGGNPPAYFEEQLIRMLLSDNPTQYLKENTPEKE